MVRDEEQSSWLKGFCTVPSVFRRQCTFDWPAKRGAETVETLSWPRTTVQYSYQRENRGCRRTVGHGLLDRVLLLGIHAHATVFMSELATKAVAATRTNWSTSLHDDFQEQ